MIWQKNIKIFSTMLLVLTVLFSGQADLHLFADVGEDDTAVSDEGDVSYYDGDIFVLGGLHPERELVSDAVYVFNMDSSTLIYSKNADKRVWPASTTKIMTALVVLENEKDLDKKLIAPYEAFDEFWSNDENKYGASDSSLVAEQENLTVRDALYGMMLPSGCDAANVLAYNTGGGDISLFIDMMNAKAAEIGCKGTNFSNAHGLFEPENYSTAYDIFLITRYVLDKHGSFFRALVSETEYSMPPNADEPYGYDVFNSNRLIQNTDGNPYYYEYAKGVKTGGFNVYHTKNSNGGWDDHDGVANLVSLAEKNSETGSFEYLIVTLGAPWYPSSVRADNEHGLHHALNDHRALYNWSFSNFDNTRVMRTTEPIASVKVIDGEKDEVKLYPLMDSDFWTLLPQNLDVNSAILQKVELLEEECEHEEECDCVASDGISAPIEEGRILGTVELVLAGQTLAKFPLVTNEAVAKTQTAIVMDRINKVFSQWWFVPLLVLIALLIIALIILGYMRKHQKQRQDNSKNKLKKKMPNKRIRR